MQQTRKLSVDLGYKPRAWQQELHAARKTHRFRVCVVHRQGGKSEAACMELVDAALKATGDLPRFAYISPRLKLGRSMFWPKLKQRLAPLIDAGVVEINESSLIARFKANKATIEMFGATDPDSIRGNTFRGAVLDEVGLMPGMVWHEIVDPTLAANQGWALFIGTPYGVNLFSELFNLSQKDPTWWSRRWTVYETNALPAAEVQRQRDTKVESVFAREFLCDFTSQSSEQLISISLATEASRRVFNPHDAAVAASPVVLGVDPARFGDDRSVIVRRQGLFMFPPLVFKGVDTMFLASRVAMEIVQHRPAAVFVDEGGVGAGVVDRLRQLGHTIQNVSFGSKSPVKGFMNLRAFMWWEMRKWLESGGGIPVDEGLIRELATPTYGFNGKGEVVVESKDDIKERLSAIEFSSPDLADALATTFAAPVSVSLNYLEERMSAGARQKERYRPFSDEARKRRGR